MTQEKDSGGQFQQEVFPAELREIARRRARLGLASPPVVLNQPSGAGVKGETAIQPSPKLGLTGIAFSGGGIRSATFCLGALQAIAARGLLRKFDYLSTVSGGGFIGSCVSSLLNQKENGPDPESFPLRAMKGTQESITVQHLRNSGNYIAPRQFQDSLRLFAVIVRGILNNLILCIPLILLAVLLTEAAYELTGGNLIVNSDRTALLTAIGFLSLAVTYPLIGKWVSRRPWGWRDCYERIFGGALFATLLVFAADAWMHLAGICVVLYPVEIKAILYNRLRYPWEQFGWVLWLIPITAACSLLATTWVASLRKHRKNVIFAWLGLCAPAVLALIYFGLCTSRIASPYLTPEFSIHDAWLQGSIREGLLSVTNSCVSDEVEKSSHFAQLPLGELTARIQEAISELEGISPRQVNGLGIARVADEPQRWLVAMPALPTSSMQSGPSPWFRVIPHSPVQPSRNSSGREFQYYTLQVGERGRSIRVWRELRPELNLLVEKCAAVNGIHPKVQLPLEIRNAWEGAPKDTNRLFTITRTGTVSNPSESVWEVQEFSRELSSTPVHRFEFRLSNGRIYNNRHQLWGEPGSWIWIVTSLGGVGVMLLFFNVNVTAVHEFYRDRLSKAYLIQTDPTTGLVSNDAQKLSELNAEGTCAPYHLLNVALNVNDSTDSNIRGRSADFFILSKHFVGGPRTGFCPTRLMEQLDPHLNLGTAVAISGAAAAPNAGSETVRSIMFLMTLLNIRLGYWCVHPGLVARGGASGRLRMKLGPGPLYLLREAFGLMHSKSLFVNLSDGGHLENLGVYELLRRRCRLILAVDGECDPELRFGSLMKLVLYAQVDLATRIDLDLSQHRLTPDGFARQHSFAADITYPDGEKGVLLYLKSSVSDDEGEWIRDYRKNHPDFPHHTTSDQFFNELEFEAYRSLGQHVAANCFSRCEADPSIGEGLNPLQFEMLRNFISQPDFGPRQAST